MKHLIITLGDPLGIGAEITKKALLKFKKLKNQKITIIGESCKGIEQLKIVDNFIKINSLYRKPTKIGASKYGADISFKALNKAIDLCLLDKQACLITAPICKESWAKLGIKFTGHTELLQDRASIKKQVLMTFVAPPFTCALATEHLAIKDISNHLTKKLLSEKLKLFSSFLGNKKIIVSALNPHSSDGGKFGKEEQNIIIPTIKNLQKQGLDVEGPFPLDSAWQKHISGKSAGIFCLYHDACLTPLKLIAKKSCVHITYGLKFLRVSPTHGTAFDIVGKNIANYNSMLSALNYASKYSCKLSKK